MRTIAMEYSQGPYSHREEFRGIHVNMGNVETKSNGRRGGKEPLTMRILLREVQIYREYNEKIMKSREEILHSLNMLQKQANKYSSTKQESSARKVTSSISHIRRDEHGNGRYSRSMNRHHHSLEKSTRRYHASLGTKNNPSVSPMRRRKGRPEGDMLQGEIGK
jgi:hypothetical protein